LDTDYRHLLLLGLLHRQEMHGYQLNEFLNRDLAFCSDLKKPTAYFLLSKMAEAGWVEEYETRDGNRPVRRVYRLTAQGESVFDELLRQNLAVYEPVYFPGDIGLALMDALPHDAVRPLLAERRKRLAEALASLQAVPAHPGSTQLAIHHQIHYLISEIAWMDQMLANLA